MKSKIKDIFSKPIFKIAITTILGIILSILISPILSFWICYFGGWVASKIIGFKIVNGLAIFGILIPICKIPLLTGVLGFASAFLKGLSLEIKTNYNNSL